MTDTTARLELPVLQPSQAQKHVTHNEALVRLDTITQLVLSGLAAQTPPVTPDAGVIYALGGAPGGAWAGQGGQLAQWTGSHWQFITPQAGWLAWDAVDGVVRVYKDGDWEAALSDLAELGVGTAADAVNRLAVASEASLFTHAGAGHQLKINKAGAGDTASLLYQSGWSGRAEIGLTGTDDLQVKVSADGAAWTDALTVDGATGTLHGAAVQSHPVDTTADRLMPVGAFGLGSVAAAPQIVSLDDSSLPSGFYRVAPGTLGSYPPGTVIGDLMVRRESGAWVSQTFTRRGDTGGQSYVRSYHAGTGYWSSWALIYSQATVLGTVSQSGGTPTGALIERGVTAQGDYVRLADGTQICTHEINLGDPTASGSGSFADPYSAPVGGLDITFARAFSAAPVLSFSHRVTGGGGGPLSRVFAPSYASVSATGITGYRAVRGTGDGDTDDVHVAYTATGRWF